MYLLSTLWFALLNVSLWFVVCFSSAVQESELERLSAAREAEVKFIREQNELEVGKASEMANIETHKFKNMVDAIGPQTIATIATAGPEMQVYTAYSTMFTLHV